MTPHPRILSIKSARAFFISEVCGRSVQWFFLYRIGDLIAGITGHPLHSYL